MTRKKYAWIALVILIICLPFMMGHYNDVIGIYNVIRGGTGCQTLTDHGVLLGSGTDAVTVTDSGADGEVLVSNGAAADPDWEYIPRQNLLKNTGWIFMSNADTARGLGTLNYDAGTDTGGDTPDVGDAVTGDTSGATGKIISITVATGTFAGDDATGTIVLGACSGRFQDNETISFTDGEDATVNMPNSAAGVDKLRNGDFSVDTDPPPGWSVDHAGTITTEAGGKVGNCLMITCDGEANPRAYQAFTVTGGKTYYCNAYAKQGTEATASALIYDATNAADLYVFPDVEAAGDWSTQFSRYFTAPATCTSIRLYLLQKAGAGAATTMYFDEVSVYEVAPGCTAADALGPDGWWKDTTIDVYQQYNDATYTKAGSFYSAKLVPSAQDDFLIYPVGYYQQTWWAERFRGETVTFGLWALSSTANDFRIQLNDGVLTSYSDYHPGDGTWQWIEMTKTFSTSAAACWALIQFHSATPGIAYVSQPMLCFGSSIGAGNYVPEADRWVYFEKGITSQTFHGKTGANGFSDATNSAITLVSDTGGLIGWGCRSFEVAMSCNDSASAGTACYMSIGPVASTTRVHDFWVQPYGLPNDGVRYGHGRVTCGTAGTYYYTIDATGGSTFDIPTYRYTAAEWR